MCSVPNFDFIATTPASARHKARSTTTLQLCGAAGGVVWCISIFRQASLSLLSMSVSLLFFELFICPPPPSQEIDIFNFTPIYLLNHRRRLLCKFALSLSPLTARALLTNSHTFRDIGGDRYCGSCCCRVHFRRNSINGSIHSRLTHIPRRVMCSSNFLHLF